MFFFLRIQEANAAALIWAAFQGDLEQVQHLLGKITDINAFDEVCTIGTMLSVWVSTLTCLTRLFILFYIRSFT